MKKVFRWLCPVLFLLIAAAVVWFLHLFTVMDTTMEYINWESSVQIMDDGSEVPFSQDIYSNSNGHYQKLFLKENQILIHRDGLRYQYDLQINQALS